MRYSILIVFIITNFHLFAQNKFIQCNLKALSIFNVDINQDYKSIQGTSYFEKNGNIHTKKNRIANEFIYGFTTKNVNLFVGLAADISMLKQFLLDTSISDKQMTNRYSYTVENKNDNSYYVQIGLSKSIDFNKFVCNIFLSQKIGFRDKVTLYYKNTDITDYQTTNQTIINLRYLNTVEPISFVTYTDFKLNCGYKLHKNLTVYAGLGMYYYLNYAKGKFIDENIRYRNDVINPDSYSKVKQSSRFTYGTSSFYPNLGIQYSF